MTTLDTYLSTLPGRCSYGFAEVQHPTLCGCSTEPADEWSFFARTLRAVAVDGLIHQRDMRARIRGRIEPKHIGSLYRKARAEGLIRDTGEREQSDDVAGRNADKLDRIYALVGAR